MDALVDIKMSTKEPGDEDCWRILDLLGACVLPYEVQLAPNVPGPLTRMITFSIQLRDKTPCFSDTTESTRMYNRVSLQPHSSLLQFPESYEYDDGCIYGSIFDNGASLELLTMTEALGVVVD